MNSEKIEKQSNGREGSCLSAKTLLIWLAAFVVAFLLWFYVASTTTQNVEYAERSLTLEIEYYGIESIASKGLGVAQSDWDIVTVTVYGEKSVIDKIGTHDITAYVDISSQRIEESRDDYVFEVEFDTGRLKGITCTYQSVEKVKLKIDKMAETTIAISSREVILSGWTIGSGLSISDKKAVNINEVKIEGMQLDLDRIASISIESVVSSAINSVGKMDSEAKIVLYDAAGKVIDNDDFVITAYLRHGSELVQVDTIVVTFEIVKAVA